MTSTVCLDKLSRSINYSVNSEYTGVSRIPQALLAVIKSFHQHSQEDVTGNHTVSETSNLQY